MVFILKLSLYSLLPLVFFIVFIIKWFSSSSTPPKKLLPSPIKLPIIGNLHQLGFLPHRSLYLLSKKYGPLMLLHFGSIPVLVASSADAAAEIMKKHDMTFANRPKSSIAHRLVYASKDVAFSPYGEYWRQMRSICVLQLLSNKRVQSFRGVREEETSLMIEKIKERCISSSSSSSLVNFSDIFVTLTNDTVCRVALGRKYGDEVKGRKAKANIAEFLRLLGVFNVGEYIPWLSWMNRLNGLDARVERVAKEIDEFMEDVLKEHKDKSNTDDSSDLVDILLEVQKENLTGFPIVNDSIKAIILDMFAAGTDATHTIMEWGMAELLRHPKIMKKLQIEVRQIAQGKSEITEDDLDKMHYLKAAIKEALRLHPPLPLLIPRESTQNIRVMRYDVSAGTRVIVNAWAIGRDPKLWDNPDEFKPDRFLNSNIDFRGFNFELIPFGVGRRGCPGISFAVAVNELALAKLVNKFDFELPDGAKPEDLDMSEDNGIAVHKKKPLLAVATLHVD